MINLVSLRQTVQSWKLLNNRHRHTDTDTDGTDFIPWTTDAEGNENAGVDAPSPLVTPSLSNIVACQRGGVSNKPPFLQAATRHSPLINPFSLWTGGLILTYKRGASNLLGYVLTDFYSTTYIRANGLSKIKKNGINTGPIDYCYDIVTPRQVSFVLDLATLAKHAL